MNKLPNKLLKLRKHYAYSQSYIADLLNIDTITYMNYENGNKIPRYNELKILAKFYNIPLQAFIINEYEIELRDEEKYDIDSDNYKYFAKLAKKERIEYLIKKNIKLILIGIVAILIILLFIFLQPSKKQLNLKRINKADNYLSASNTTVVYMDEFYRASGKGDNAYGQLDFNFNDVFEIEEGNNFTIVLHNDGTISQVGLINKFASELEKLKNIVQIEAGNSHILALDNKGKVYCIGDNRYNQCAIKEEELVKTIFADNNASIVIKEDGTIISSGNFLGKEHLSDLNGIKAISISNEISAFVDNDGKIKYYSSGKEYTDVNNYNDIVDVACGDEFIAALDGSGKVFISLANNFKIVQEVESWENVKSIEAGKDYLVALIGNEIKGVGNNEYNQFNIPMSQKIPLTMPRNVKISYDDDNLIISFDPVSNATSYDLSIDTGIGIAINSKTNQFKIDLNRFEDNQEYTIELIAKGDDKYEDSTAAIINYRFSDPRNVENGDAQITLEKMTGMTRGELVSYLTSLGVKRDNIKIIDNLNIICEGDIKEIVSIDGVKDYETLTLNELMRREIVSYCCMVKNDENMAD